VNFTTQRVIPAEAGIGLSDGMDGCKPDPGLRRGDGIKYLKQLPVSCFCGGILNFYHPR
jgi:hypothetical protein